MRIHYFQHVEYNDRAFLPEWADAEGHELIRVMVPVADELPDADEIDALIIVGGPMSIWDERQHPWLVKEKQLLAELLRRDRPVLGICLGAQMMAEHLGSPVKPWNNLNIGWYPIEFSSKLNKTYLHNLFPDCCDSFFWHGDVFALPEGAAPIARDSTEASRGFVWQRSIALQFHLEVTPQWARHLVTRDAPIAIFAERWPSG